MIDRKHIGANLGRHSSHVEAGRLRFFAKAIGETDPIYTDEAAARAAGYAALPAPPTFAFSLNMDKPDPFALMELLEVDLGRVLHGEQEFAFEAPIIAGDTITFESRIADIYAKKNGALEFVVEETIASNQHGQIVVRMRSVTVVRN